MLLYIRNGNTWRPEEGRQLREGSSEDEELEEEYANIEVNFDESETEEEEYVPKVISTQNKKSEPASGAANVTVFPVYRRLQEVSLADMSANSEDVPELEDLEDVEAEKTGMLPDFRRSRSSPGPGGVAVSCGKSYIQSFSHPPSSTPGGTRNCFLFDRSTCLCLSTTRILHTEYAYHMSILHAWYWGTWLPLC